MILPFFSLEWEIFIIWPMWLEITPVTWICFCWLIGSFPVSRTSICNCTDSRNICNRVPGSWDITCGSDGLVKMFLCKCFSFDYLWKSSRKTCHTHQRTTAFKNSLWLSLQIIFLCQPFVALSVFAHLDGSLDKLFTEVFLVVTVLVAEMFLRTMTFTRQVQRFQESRAIMKSFQLLS